MTRPKVTPASVALWGAAIVTLVSIVVNSRPLGAAAAALLVVGLVLRRREGKRTLPTLFLRSPFITGLVVGIGGIAVGTTVLVSENSARDIVAGVCMVVGGAIFLTLSIYGIIPMLRHRWRERQPPELDKN